jgi:glyoxylase-like metal-dependent hydrolase (beta-lactamase superfamily II)
LQDATGAPTVGFRDSGLETFEADIKLADGDQIAGMQAIHTPGHASDHLCFALPTKDGTAVLFSADHVMSWSTSVVSPPGGDMADYFASLRLMLERTDDVFLPGHGPALADPRTLVREMLTHRMIREQAIESALAKGAAGTFKLMDALYSQVHPRLRRAAERNVLAHLLKLEAEGKVVRDGEVWRAA